MGASLGGWLLTAAQVWDAQSQRRAGRCLQATAKSAAAFHSCRRPAAADAEECRRRMRGGCTAMQCRNRVGGADGLLCGNGSGDGFASGGYGRFTPLRFRQLFIRGDGQNTSVFAFRFSGPPCFRSAERCRRRWILACAQRPDNNAP